MKIKFKKLNERAQMPTKAYASDAGFDLVATSYEIDNDLNIISYGTGIATEIPEGYFGLLVPRSSVYKEQLSLSNCAGILDSHYRGEIMFKYRIERPLNRFYHPGDRIGQLIILPCLYVEFEETDELSDSDRGTGGYGSTGK